MKRLNISSGTEWEKKAGYSRAVRAGNLVWIAGTTAMEAGQVIGGDSLYEQAMFIFKRIESALKATGGSLSDVVRTRMYITDLSQTEAVMKAHGETFGEILPTATLVEVSGLILPELLIEIEADAWIDEP